MRGNLHAAGRASCLARLGYDNSCMDPFRLSAAGGALALHALVLAGVLTLAAPPPAPRAMAPLEVALIAPPEPLPAAPVAPARPAAPRRIDPPAAAPSPPAPPPPPAVTKPPPKPAAAKPESPGPAPPTASAPAREPLVRPSPEPVDDTAAITPPPAASATPEPPAETVPAREAESAPAAGTPAAPPASASAAHSGPPTGDSSTGGPVRSAPRVDASWRGNSPPPYPGLARRMGQEGEVRLDVRVGIDGKVTEIRLRQSSGSALLDRTAIDTVRKWRFEPATIDGQPVAEWYHDWRWVFRLEG